MSLISILWISFSMGLILQSTEVVLPDDDSFKPALYQGLVEGFQVCGLLLDEILQFIDAGNLCVPGGSVNRAFSRCSRSLKISSAISS